MTECLQAEPEKKDAWVPTKCQMCAAACGVLVHRLNGEVVGIRGNPDDQSSLGRICSKAFSSLLMLNDPNRVNVPLKRTNPKKGIGIDPEWVEIAWDEALDIIVEKLKKIKSEDPRKLLCTSSITVWEPMEVLGAFGEAFGSPNSFGGGAGPCGDAQHLTACQRYGVIAVHPDPTYCNYFLDFGCSEGTGSYWAPTGMAQRIADARERGMRMVVIDPVFSQAAAKADEWIPIRPGTDALLALAMLNVLLNELKIYDAFHLKKWTNGPYLVNEEGYYIRDRETGKPLIWDPTEKRAKSYDDQSIQDYALEGQYTINGTVGSPAFSLLRNHVKKYAPEGVSDRTTVPVGTIRRIAKEFGEAAAVGSFIEIDGHTLPLRPVATAYYKSIGTHANGFANCTAVDLLTEVVGARSVPGGIVGTARCLGYPKTGLPSYAPRVSVDGFFDHGA